MENAFTVNPSNWFKTKPDVHQNCQAAINEHVTKHKTSFFPMLITLPYARAPLYGASYSDSEHYSTIDLNSPLAVVLFG